MLALYPRIPHVTRSKNTHEVSYWGKGYDVLYVKPEGTNYDARACNSQSACGARTRPDCNVLPRRIAHLYSGLVEGWPFSCIYAGRDPPQRRRFVVDERSGGPLVCGLVVAARPPLRVSEDHHIQAQQQVSPSL